MWTKSFVLFLPLLTFQATPLQNEGLVVIDDQSKDPHSNRLLFKQSANPHHVSGHLNLKVDDRNGMVREGPYKEAQGPTSIPKVCTYEDTPCKRIDSRVINPNLNNGTTRRRRSVNSEVAEETSGSCHFHVKVEAFGHNYTLCLERKSFKDHGIIKDIWSNLNVTVYGAGNETKSLAISEMDIHFVAGHVVDESFTSVSGFLLDDHFYGTVYMRDSVHYLEPHDRKSRDMKIFGDGLKTLLHKHDVSKQFQSPRAQEVSGDPDANPGQLCDLTLVADHLFFNQVGEGSLEKTLTQMLWHVKEANSLLKSMDFDDDGKSECVGLSVSEISVFTSENSPFNFLRGSFEVPEDFLKQFSRYNFEGFCLGTLFTNRDFKELVLGLSWRGNAQEAGVGGICQARVKIQSDLHAYSFNALFISLRSAQEDRIPLRMGVLNLVHELMHSFGAKHDPEAKDDPSCTPNDKETNGRFLMSKYSNDGHKLNHEILSPCTKSLVMQNLKSSTRTKCLKASGNAFCGDGLVQEGEDCDCGTTFQCIAAKSCCIPPEGGHASGKPCSLRKGCEVARVEK